MVDMLIIGFVGFVATFVSTTTGGSGLIIVPTLIFLGLTSQEAVATAIFGYMGIGTMGWLAFHEKKQCHYDIALPATLIFFIGVILGSMILLNVSTDFLRRFIGIFTLFFVALSLYNRKWGVEKRAPSSSLKRLIGYLLFLPLGVQNGMMAGGSATIATYILIGLFGQTFLESAGTRKPVFFGRTVASFLILAPTGLIHWYLGLALLLATGTGSYLGTHYQVAKGNAWVRRIFLFVTIIMAMKLLV